ncbi:AAA family ATPase [Pseudanabaena sp. 'Roaring Creek']|uniref:AAA family ATPase n=1 Tax=Pseudanabaena sp. 'Roaring Creek' TaxID=1681830 RepID=UPI0006D7D667|nr:AAA family ATPase [Pseudanabaena sp. 'Roaring Creek']
MFKITDHIEFDHKGRAHCPVCLSDGKKSKNLSLIPNTDGAYRCHRGCSSEDIRAAIGQPKNENFGDRVVPTAIAKPPKRVTHTQAEIEKNHQTLITESKLAKQWLNDRGFTDATLSKYKLGICLRTFGKNKLWCVTIPYEISKGVWQRKYRLSPWLESLPDGLKDWTQDTGLTSRFHFTKQDGNKKLMLVEGDWDAMMLTQVSLDADFPYDIATNTTGCGNIPSDLSPIDSYEEIYIFYDLDQPDAKGKRPGPDGAIAIAKAIGERAKVCTVPHPENPKDKYDTSDSLKDGFTLDDFIKATKEAIAPTASPKTEKKPSLKSRLTTTAELMARAKDYTDWLIDEILPINELILLAASPRAGKSLMAMNIAQCVASGTNFLDRPVTQGNVIYVQCEDSETKTKQRAIAQGWDENLPVFWLDKFKLSELDELIELAKEIQPRLIVLDTLSRIRDDNATESSAEMGRVLEPLQEFAKHHNCCILPIHHTGKINIDNAKALDVFETIRGSSAIRATCRGTLVIAANETGYRLCVENGYNKQDLKVSLNLTDLTWKLLGKWGMQVDAPQTEQVLDSLTKVEHATLEQLHELTGINKASLYKVLSRLVHDEKISKTGSQRNVVYSRLFQKLAKTQSDKSDMSDLLSDSENQTPQTIEVQSDKKSISFISDNKQVQKNADVITENPNNLSDCQTRLSNAIAVSISESDNKSDKPESVRLSKLKVGDRVKIMPPHFLSGQTATIEAIYEPNAILKNDSWAVNPSVDISLLKRAR